MTNSAQALHNAVRRYCYDKHRYWCDVYAALREKTAGGYHYSDKQLDVFPRYNVLNAICIAVESMDLDSLFDFNETKKILAAVGQTAEDMFTQAPLGPIEKRAQDEERDKYSEFVSSLTETDVWAYDQLPYRRVLSEAESSRAWALLESTWGLKRRSYWYPLAEAQLHLVAAFAAEEFHKHVPTHALVRMLQSMGVDRVWELREYGPEYVHDVEDIDPTYNGAEGFWTSPEADWLIYASHEWSITLAGPLLRMIQAQWPTWESHVVDPFF